MDDLISRSAAINVIERTRAYIGHNMERAVGAAFIEILDDVGEDIGRLPSAQPTFDARDTQYNLPIGTDLISRKQAIDALGEEPPVWHDGEDEIAEQNQWKRDIEAIKQLPPIQPVIVRCKDCKHWIPYDWMFSEVWQSKNIADYPEDEIGCNFCDMAMKANDFCSRGERREDG